MGSEAARRETYVIAARWRGFSDDQAREMAVQTAASYRESMRTRERATMSGGLLELSSGDIVS